VRRPQIYITKIALIISAIFLFHYQFFAQNNTLELLPGADKFEFNQTTGIHRLIGSVNFIYQGNTMYCDSAHYKEKSQEVRAYGNVHITKRDLNLFCDSLYYQGVNKKAKLWGNVRVRDQEYKITTDTLEYDANKSVAIYRFGGKVESILNGEVLTSKVGYMYSKSKDMFFSHGVNYRSSELRMVTDTLRYNYKQKTAYFFGPTNINQLENNKTKGARIYCEKGWYNTDNKEATLQNNASIFKDNQLMKGDYLYSNSQKGISTGKGNVIYKDTSEKIEFRGDYAYSSDLKRLSYLTGKALVLKIDGKDTLFIHADTLFSLKDSLGKATKMKGYNNVKIFRNELQAKCDSLVYDKIIGKMELYKDPIVWVKTKTELKGDFVEIYFVSDTIIEKANVIGNSTVLFEIDSGKYYNQIGGKDILAFFKGNDIYRTDVKGNARTISFPENTEKNDSTIIIKRLGMNRIYSSDLRVYIDSNEIQGITYIDKPDGVFYPMEKLNKEEQFIKGFKWMAALRPKTWKEILK
jgi:lipopolysaccharide export system protein LptA